MAIPPNIRARLEQLKMEAAVRAEQQRRQAQAQQNAEKMAQPPVPGKAKGGFVNDAHQKWFGGSKVVDDQGNPLVVYHGTANDITQFKSNRNGLIYAARSPGAAEYYARIAHHGKEQEVAMGDVVDDGSRMSIYPIHLSAQNPFDPDDKSHLAKLSKTAAKEIRATNGSFEEIERHAKEIRAAGFDAVYVRESEDSPRSDMDIAVFDPAQIKSAIGNRGTYDPSNPDITKAKGGEVKQPSLDTMKLALTQKGGVLPKEEHDENLRKFLEQSHIKDRLYHATPENFSEFKPGGKDPTLSGPAIWLSPDPTQQPAAHNIWGGSRGFKEGTNVMPVHVQAKNPLILDDETMIEWAREVFADGSREFPDLLAPKTVAEIKKEGYDSIIHADPYKTGRPHEVIMFDPNKIKSATANRGTFDTSSPDITKAEGGKVQPSVAQMKLALNNQGMYSPLEKAAMSVPRTKGTPAEFMAEISKQPGFRKEEVEDRKISLPEQKMTKAEMLAHIQSHEAPKLQERVFGGNDYLKALDEAAQQIIGDPYASFDDLHGRDRDKARIQVESEWGYDPETKHEKWRLPGGENYREVLLKLPQRGLNEAQKRNLMNYEADVRRGAQLDPWHQKQYEELLARKNAGNQDFYATHHWEDPNVLAHLRLSDRKGPNGEKILHVEEVQSDWHQAGRKEGYATGDTTGWRVQGTNIDDPSEVQVLNAEGKPVWSGTATGTDRQIIEKAAKSGVPDAPFKKNWHELALKHVLGMAAKGGYHGIAITPGAEQAKRYDLSKQVQEVIASPYGKDSYNIMVKDNDGRIHAMGEKNVNDLPSLVGKDLAEKITQTGGGSFTGLDLQVGGEGMKGFYDKIVPTFLNKLGKPHGAQVGTINVAGNPTKRPEIMQQMGVDPIRFGLMPREQRDEISRQADARNQQALHYFPITDSLRQQINTEGLPQYEHGGGVHPLLPEFED